MTQVNRAQRANNKVASISRARSRTLAGRRADLEDQVREFLLSTPTMALTEPTSVKARMKDLRARAGLKQYEVALALDEPPRTYQSWENAEVETDRKNYEKVAAFYTKRLKQKVSANWILFGQDTEPPLPSVTTPDLMTQYDPDPDAPQWARELLEEIRIVRAYVEAIDGARRLREEDPPTREEAA